MKSPITAYPSVQLWFKKAIHSERGADDALRRLSRFFETVNVEPSAVIEKWRSVRYDLRERKIFSDKWEELIEAYYYNLDESYAPLTKKSIITPVISFFKHHKIPIEPHIQDRVYVKYHNRDIPREEFKKILKHACLRDRTFFLMMAESGQRPYTLVQLRYKNIKQDFEAGRVPMKIDLPAELLKDRVGHRFTFIGEDTLDSLKAYLRPRLPLKNSDTIFAPLRKGRMKGKFVSPEAFGNAFCRIVLKLNLDEPVEGGKPKGLRLYCLRKYFQNKIRVSDIGFREFWMGHTFGTDEHYLSRDVERHREEYAKAYDSIRIFKPEIPESIDHLRQYYEGELEKLRGQLIHSQQENMRILEQQEQMLKKHREDIEEIRAQNELVLKYVSDILLREEGIDLRKKLEQGEQKET